MSEQYTSDEGVEKARRMIMKYMELLPTPEQNRLETYLALMQIREQQLVVLELNSDKQNSVVLAAEIEIVKKKMEAVDKLMDIDTKMATLYKQLMEDPSQTANMQGAALKKNRFKLQAQKNLEDKVLIDIEKKKQLDLKEAEKQMSNTDDEQSSESLGEPLDS